MQPHKILPDISRGAHCCGGGVSASSPTPSDYFTLLVRAERARAHEQAIIRQQTKVRQARKIQVQAIQGNPCQRELLDYADGPAQKPTC